MGQLIARGLEKSFGDKWVLRGCDLRVDTGDRIGLVGVNGSGKSTLLSVLSGQVSPDHGRLEVKGSMSWLRQLPHLSGLTVEDIVQQAVNWHGNLLRNYQMALETENDVLASELQDRLDNYGWDLTHKIDGILDQVKAPTRTQPIEGLSGGERRRVSLAATLLAGPDLLLLDEPTNHLDGDTVEWLQRYLAGFRGGLVLVTHDRYLLEAVAESIVEVEHGKTVHYDGSYGDYLVARAERHERQLQADDRRRKLLAREAAWAARSPAARSTKQKARLQRLDDLKIQGDVPQDRDFVLDFSTGFKKGGTMLEAHGLSKGHGNRALFSDLDVSLLPGETLAIMGPNGADWTTTGRPPS